MNATATVDVLGLRFHPVSLDETVARIQDAVRTGSALHIVTGNVDFVMKARRDPGFAETVNRAQLCVADGVPVLWAARLLGQPLPGRVNGTDLVWRCAEVSASTGSPVALVGSAPDRARKAAERMMAAAPGARVVAVPTPDPLSEEQAADVAQAVRDSGAGILLAALGAPRQERFIARWREASGAAVAIGIGGALEFVSGDAPRAPRWMQRRGLEWAHRLLLEPRRLWRRYLLEGLPFAPLLLRAWWARRSALRRSGRTAP